MLLTLLPDPPQVRSHNRYCHYQCECGNTIWTRAARVERGLVTNCGCVRAQYLKAFLSSEEGNAARQKAYQSRMKNRPTPTPKPKKAPVNARPRVPLSAFDPEHAEWVASIEQQKALRERLRCRA